MTSKWGTCNPDTGKLWFKLQLAKKTPECLEYVIIHELTHLLERTHNERFVAYMDRFMPLWREVKEDKWADDIKHGTKVDGTFEEFGEMPSDNRRGYSEYNEIIDRIRAGATNTEILNENPDFFRVMRDVEYVRQILKAEEYREKWRNIETVYIWGTTGVGKTRFVMDGCGYSNVYAVNDYKHPFDGYAGESVMLFDEFNSNFRIQDMNNYLDGYPLSLPARYSNKQACYERIFIVSNLDLWEQYHQERLNQRNV